MADDDIFWRTYRSLEEDVLKITDYSYVSDKGCIDFSQTYSIVNANLLMQISVQIEALSKKIYDDILKLMNPIVRAKPEYNKEENDIHFDTDCISLINKTYHSDKVPVYLYTSRVNLEENNRKFCPLKDSELKDCRKWQKSYQAVKHDYVDSLDRGTTKNVLHACGALFLLNVYNSYKDGIPFDDVTKKEIQDFDYTFGSKLFSVEKPKVPGEFDKLDIPLPSESPFVVNMDKEHFEQFKCKRALTIEEVDKTIDNVIKNYEGDYRAFLSNYNKNAKIKLNRYDAFYIWYFRNVTPKNLSFEERKERFLSLNEVRRYIRTDLKHLNIEDEITPENIDQKIDQYGLEMGLSIEATSIDNLYNSSLFDMFIQCDKTLW